MRKIEMIKEDGNSKIQVKGWVLNNILDRNGKTIGYEVMYDSNGKKNFITCMLNVFKVVLLKNVNVL